MPTALVVGGGVAGPAVAMFLARAGWEVRVVEAAPTPGRHGGAFLNVASNGLDVLAQLGLRDALVADGHRAGRMVMLSGRGRELGVVPNGPAGDLARGGVIVRRAHLHAVLRDGAARAGIPIEDGVRVTGIRSSTDAAIATLADGRELHADVLIGADGIGSLTRTWIDPGAPAPTYTGLVGLGGFARVPGLAPTHETRVMVFGARAFFGYLVRDDGTALWFANLTRPEPDRRALAAIPSDRWLADLAELHRDDPFPVPDLVASTVGPVSAHPIHALPHVPHWYRDRVVALGDAVHATSPSAGQGASLALEDAITLARALRDAPDHGAAFAAFERMRRPRVERIVGYARAVDRNKRVTRSRLGIAVRDAMLPRFLGRAMEDHRNDDLYEFRVDWNAKGVPVG
ncbi:FAD-dependent oxidoreductase [Agromyces luteolus]|uniref:NAD(P)-binding protein n=1 Tax=Agromyces luteolus TaxID=88373 RepID=A0A7C9LJ36_9MICO|nr:NAD(P)/FAD-dependent oxidoreductase [Agromyces luteolus]MUN08995.1 NAD(P)-binding protein [Agromyces luteolus]GLK28683.1 FAD-dependent oxidoreductase [Agromyces luteolus]